jgi:hypothetical protein
MYVKTSFGARKGRGCCASHLSLLDTFGPGPLTVTTVPLAVIVPILAWVLRVAFRLCVHVPLASLPASMGSYALALLIR